MAAAAAKASDRALLKVKLGGAGDPERIAAVRRAAPQAELIVDANEGWTQRDLTDNLAACAAAGVTLIEQPLPDGEDAVLSAFRHPVPICADESAHARASLAALAGRYDAVNIKLDKTGGLTEAWAGEPGAHARPRDHGRLHGRHLARHGTGDAADAGGHLGRSRRPAAAAVRPCRRPAIRRQRRPPRRTGLLGLIVAIRPHDGDNLAAGGSGGVRTC
jgi:L-alanine-DL-glutamate epimerase-like enolase superfamily enzyme